MSNVTASSTASSNKRTKGKVGQLAKMIWDEFYFCDVTTKNTSNH